MYPVSERFHELATQSSPLTRCRIYFIGDSVDCTDDTDVIANGTLLVREVGDTDSGRRISENGGISINDLFNSEENLQIGRTVSKPINMTLLNVDGALSGFAFGRCKVFIDVYDPEEEEWLTCPVGVFIIETPTKRNSRLVTCQGYDQMQLLNVRCDAWYNSLNWENGITVASLISGIATQCGVHVSSSLSTRILNGSHAYTSPPMTVNQNTYRDILAYLCGVTGTIAYFDRDGALDMRWFSAPTIDGDPVTISADAVGNGIMQIDVAEYEVAPIDAVEILSFDVDLNTTIGTGSNVFQISGNPFINGADASDIETLATPIFTRLTALDAYRPISMNLITDWSLESGDIIYIIKDTVTIPLPIMQQKLTWRGGYVFSEMQSSGEAERKNLEPNERIEYQNAVQMHEFVNTANELSSRIQDLSGNYSLIQQTISSIEQAVSGQGTLIQSILDPTGQIWTAIKTNSSNVSNLEAALNDEVSERKTYIRFIVSEPAIVIGVDTGNEIKLKLVNNVIYFFNGSDDSTDLSLAYAYFNSEEAGADRFVATESVQIGNADSSNRWLWKMLANGDLVLDLV